ncbi:MAG: Flp pilus assembly complex ATPase component TadA [Gammaproteobacteria bacterium]|nr:Flp pilus assembly complex ATPase component TadA [Gammaproteobacteria bacterium]NNL99164.1 Flp pilus assembly complex ATPase component TadA [Gammaproteobacteria bacterium]
MFSVIIKNDKGETLHKFRAKGDSCKIGKARGNDIQLRGWKVSPEHAVIYRTVEGLFVESKSQKHRVQINGEAQDSYGPLRTSDEINIGGYVLHAGQLKSRKEAEAAAEAPPLPPIGDADDEEEENEDHLKTVIGVIHHAEVMESPTLSKEIQKLQEMDKFKWRNRVHDELLAAMDLRRTDVSSMDEDELKSHVSAMIKEIITGMDGTLPKDIDRKKLAKQVLDEAVGLGPLEDLLARDDITEIMVNKYDEIYIEEGGKLFKSDITFSSDDAVMSAIERIVSPLGRRIDESSPMVDARLKDGSRVNAIIPPLALRGPCLTIRKFSKEKLTDQDLVKFGAINAPMVKFLKVAVEQRKNIIISGGTGSGKTTLLNMLSSYIPPDERIVTVEDAAELQLSQPHLVSLEARPPNLEGKGAVPIRDLVKNCLRMRPDRIVVGECRGGEALDMLQAMNTGHDGSLTTAHANTPRDLIARLEVMVMMSGMDLPAQAIREQVASAVDIIVQQTRFADGSRKIVAISEVTGVESGTVQMQDIFRFQQEGFDENHRVKGHFLATGRVPEFYEDLSSRGLDVDLSIFDKSR